MPCVELCVERETCVRCRGPLQDPEIVGESDDRLDGSQKTRKRAHVARKPHQIIGGPGEMTEGTAWARRCENCTGLVHYHDHATQ